MNENAYKTLIPVYRFRYTDGTTWLTFKNGDLHKIIWLLMFISLTHILYNDSQVRSQKIIKFICANSKDTSDFILKLTKLTLDAWKLKMR